MEMAIAAEPLNICRDPRLRPRTDVLELYGLLHTHNKMMHKFHPGIHMGDTCPDHSGNSHQRNTLLSPMWVLRLLWVHLVFNSISCQPRLRYTPQAFRQHPKAVQKYARRKHVTVEVLVMSVSQIFSLGIRL